MTIQRGGGIAVDKLDSIFELQKELDRFIEEHRNLDDIPYEVWMQKDILAIIAELGELLDEVNFKWWKNPKEIDKASIKEELADILHFFISMCIRTGMDPEELYCVYHNKNKENFNRQLGRSAKSGYKI
ncbi:MAG: dUTPase [Firmicutes bacterium ADurb.Bin182]|nr:MAG: dUTPase [Firmicutes bacterium ADurb.Bin182]